MHMVTREGKSPVGWCISEIEIRGYKRREAVVRGEKRLYTKRGEAIQEENGQ